MGQLYTETGGSWGDKMTILRCPHCRNKIQININAAGRNTKPHHVTLESSHRSPLDSEAAVPPMPTPKGYEAFMLPMVEAERQYGAFLPNIEAHVGVPFRQALISGVFFGLGTSLIVCALGYRGGMTFWGAILAGGGWMLFSTFAVAWWKWESAVNYYNSLLWRIERATRMDVDQDGQIGEPKPEPPTVRVEVKEGSTWRFANLPGDDESLQKFASDILNGIRTFSEEGAKENGYGIENFKKLRVLFLEKGWAVWNHPSHRQQGVSLTRSGQWVLKEVANTPLPYRDAGVQNIGTVARGSTRHEIPLSERMVHINQ